MFETVNKTTIPSISNIATIPNTKNQYSNMFRNLNYTSLLIEYLPGIEKELENNPNTEIYILDEKYAILSVANKSYKDIIRSIKNLCLVVTHGLNTPNTIAPIDSTKHIYTMLIPI